MFVYSGNDYSVNVVRMNLIVFNNLCMYVGEYVLDDIILFVTISSTFEYVFMIKYGIIFSYVYDLVLSFNFCL